MYEKDVVSLDDRGSMLSKQDIGGVCVNMRGLSTYTCGILPLF
jgi:hypothetical protein